MEASRSRRRTGTAEIGFRGGIDPDLNYGLSYLGQKRLRRDGYWDRRLVRCLGFGGVRRADWIQAAFRSAIPVKRAIGLPRAAWGRTLAHFGLAVTVAGVTGAGLGRLSIQIMRPGDKVEVSGYEFTFEGAENVRGPNYGAERGTFTVRDDGQVVVELSGERRRYFVSATRPRKRESTPRRCMTSTRFLGSRTEKALDHAPLL